jgi:hypothetical protein
VAAINKSLAQSNKSAPGQGDEGKPIRPPPARRNLVSNVFMAATNKCLARNNKSHTGDKATNRRFRQICVLPEDEFHKTMTLQEAKSIARHLGLTLRKVRSGDYRVNFRDGNETTAYYTDSLEDAVNTAVEMARRRVVTKVCPNCKQSSC